MVFSSVPVYLDPSNWPQQTIHQQGGVGENPQLPPVMPPPPPVGGGSPASIRPGSMAERARLAKLPQPEAALKCPRCESINTKFCYFNNYSLTQPRHFCKTCRRYWTRGGALRNVPVGGGCRRNKRSKGSRSKSPITGKNLSSSTSTTGLSSNNSCSTGMISQLPPSPQLSFFPPLHNLTDFGNADIGLNFCGIQSPVGTRASGSEIEFQIGSPSAAMGGAGHLDLSAQFADQWRLQQVQQFPFLTGLEQLPTGVYQFEGEAIDQPVVYGGVATDQLASKILEGGASVKLEDNQQGQNLSRNFLSIHENDQYWNGNAWTDHSTSADSNLM